MHRITLRSHTLTLLLTLLTLTTSAQLPSASTSGTAIDANAQSIVDKSIKYHNGKSQWESSVVRIDLKETRPNGSDRSTTLVFDNTGSTFMLNQQRGDDKIIRWTDGNECSHKVNGSEDFTEQKAKDLNLNCEYTIRMRDYYTYLYGLPAKLKDPGTIIHPEVRLVEFDGQELHQVRVTYEGEVGSDIWYFYFDTKTAALSGYRFYHDEDANDGEYITLKDEVTSKGLRLPKERTWYVHKDGRVLGSDIIVRVEVGKGN